MASELEVTKRQFYSEYHLLNESDGNMFIEDFQFEVFTGPCGSATANRVATTGIDITTAISQAGNRNRTLECCDTVCIDCCERINNG